MVCHKGKNCIIPSSITVLDQIKTQMIPNAFSTVFSIPFASFAATLSCIQIHKMFGTCKFRTKRFYMFDILSICCATNWNLSQKIPIVCKWGGFINTSSLPECRITEVQKRGEASILPGGKIGKRLWSFHPTRTHRSWFHSSRLFQSWVNMVPLVDWLVLAYMDVKVNSATWMKSGGSVVWFAVFWTFWE